MNQLLEPKASEPPPGDRPRFWQDENTQSIIVGLILTFIIWPLLVLGFSWAIGHLHGKDDGKFIAKAHGRQFNIQLAPQELKQPPKPPPNRFVETNPDAPENIPDQTRNFAAKNQQAAQGKPTPNGHSDHAATQGRKDINSTQIVDGHLNNAKPAPSAPPVPVPAKPSQATPRLEQNPLTGFEKSDGEAKDAFATNVAKIAENNKNVPQKIEGLKNTPLIENADSSVPQIDPKHPMPRQRLDQNVRPAIFSDNPVGTSNIGIAGWDARWSNYGEYLQRLIDTVQAEWDNLLNNSNASPPSGTHVLVTFLLNSDGNVSKIVKVDGNAGDLGQKYCVSAITDRGTYGKWTADMVAMMGSEQELTFTFYYQ
ncbi:MAG TPA: hypothetical protein VNW23_05670 [Opitutaceae bacterium]|jgi:hypothetical protein|nr:hypothetical protein [Opitutaceae bacterium]